MTTTYEISLEDVVEMLSAAPISFRNEGMVRTNLRARLCLMGMTWEAADAEASKVIDEALHRMGAVRPSWDEGQDRYTRVIGTPPPKPNERPARLFEHICVNCRQPFECEEKFQRYCSRQCAAKARLKV